MMRTYCLLALSLCGLSALAAVAAPCPWPPKEERDRIAARASTDSWSAVSRALLDEADALVAEALDIPRAGGQWLHWYSCSDDGASLFPHSPTEHICSACGKAHSGYPYDAVYITLRHNHWLGGVETLGHAYIVDPKPAYAERARDILLTYASFYDDLRYHDVKGEEGRAAGKLFAQTLDEAIALCKASFGYGAVCAAPCFSASDHTRIRESFLLPVCETIRRSDWGISNWQTWHNAAVASVGALLGDNALLDWATDGKSGLLFQTQKSILPGGMWHEGTPAYHYYAFQAMIYHLRAAEWAGRDLWNLPAVKRMFDAPLRLLYPDLTFPPLHNSDRFSVSSFRGLYEIAYRRFGDPRYVPLLQPRNTWEGLLHGVDDAPATGAVFRAESSNAEDEGLAVLRNADNTTALYLDYSRGISGHRHPASLSVVLYAHEEERLVDAGRLAYGNPMHAAWCRQTLAHNTVLVNEESHSPMNTAFRHFETGPGYVLARAEATAPGNRFRLDRTLLLAGSTVVDLFRCSAPEPSVFDLPMHLRAEWETPPDGIPIGRLSDAPGYRELRDARRVDPPLHWHALRTGPNRRMLVQVLDDHAQYTAVSPGYRAMESLPMLLRRAEGSDAAIFVTVIHLLEGDYSPKMVSLRQDRGVLSVKMPAFTLMVGEETLSLTH